MKILRPVGIGLHLIGFPLRIYIGIRVIRLYDVARKLTAFWHYCEILIALCLSEGNRSHFG